MKKIILSLTENQARYLQQILQVNISVQKIQSSFIARSTRTSLQKHRKQLSNHQSRQQLPQRQQQQIKLTEEPTEIERAKCIELLNAFKKSKLAFLIKQTSSKSQRSRRALPKEKQISLEEIQARINGCQPVNYEHVCNQIQNLIKNILQEHQNGSPVSEEIKNAYANLSAFYSFKKRSCRPNKIIQDERFFPDNSMLPKILVKNNNCQNANILPLKQNIHQIIKQSNNNFALHLQQKKEKNIQKQYKTQEKLFQIFQKQLISNDQKIENKKTKNQVCLVKTQQLQRINKEKYNVSKQQKPIQKYHLKTNFSINDQIIFQKRQNNNSMQIQQQTISNIQNQQPFIISKNKSSKIIEHSETFKNSQTVIDTRKKPQIIKIMQKQKFTIINELKTLKVQKNNNQEKKMFSIWKRQLLFYKIANLSQKALQMLIKIIDDKEQSDEYILNLNMITFQKLQQIQNFIQKFY